MTLPQGGGLLFMMCRCTGASLQTGGVSPKLPVGTASPAPPSSPRHGARHFPAGIGASAHALGKAPEGAAAKRQGSNPSPSEQRRSTQLQSSGNASINR